MDVLATIMLKRNGLGNTGETYLVSSENNFMLTPSRFDGNPLAKAYRRTGIDSALRGEEGFARYTNYRTPAQPVLGYYVWLDDLEAGLLAEIEQQEALAEIRNNLIFSVAMFVAFSLLAIALAVFGSTSLTRPIHELTDASTHIANGNLQQLVLVGIRPELAQTIVGLGIDLSQITTKADLRTGVEAVLRTTA
jgi:methyl-accepting chemotaxis protein